MLQTQTVTAQTLALTKKLMADARLSDFTLVGGTALALRIGHRQSIDIDLFIDKPFDAAKVATILTDDYGAEFMKVLKNGVFCAIDGVKTDLISHVYPFVQPSETWDGVRLISLHDIAAMKIHAIVQNGSRVKDFTDIYFLLEKMPLSEIYRAYETKYYPHSNSQVAKMALRDYSMVNFTEPVQLVDKEFSWKETIDRLRQAVFDPSRLFRSVDLKKQLQEEKNRQTIKRKGPRL